MSAHTTQFDMGWRRIQSIKKGRPYMIRSILFCVCFVFMHGFVDGITRWGDKQANCPESAISQTMNTDGSVDCVLKIDRDPAKVIKKSKGAGNV